MLVLMSAIFALGILGIALEDKIKVNKAATALLTALLLWIVYIISGVTTTAEVNSQIVEHLGDVSQTLFFVMSAMVIIELVDIHGGFVLITDNVTTSNKRRLLWIVSIVSFVISALLDNLATAIVMIAMLRKLVPHTRERWIYASMIIIAANAGGAWSPIGDVTTILLWNNGNLTPLHQMGQLIIPSLVCMIVSLLLVSRFFGKDDRWDRTSMPFIEDKQMLHSTVRVSFTNKIVILIAGVLSLALVPVFNYLTGLPPFMGVLLGVVFLWFYTDILYGTTSSIEKRYQYRMSRVFSEIDIATILFFLGILMSVAALQSAGQLTILSDFMSANLKSSLAISFIIGLVSSVLDNVALVAATIGMYPLEGAVGDFAVNGPFWTFLAYCAVTGGSIFIIGSATGVTVMGLEGIPFSYYFKRFSLIALIGYICGAATYLGMSMLF